MICYGVLMGKGVGFSTEQLGCQSNPVAPPLLQKALHPVDGNSGISVIVNFLSYK